MLESLAHIASRLKEARKLKKLSQRALSLKTGVPQGHLSKIENGATDLQTSSLIEIARALDLELMLVPRNLVPTFNFLILGDIKGSKKQIPKYRLDLDEEGDDV